MVDNLELTYTDWWREAYVEPIREKVDAFMEKAAHPDFELLRRMADEAEKTHTIPKIVHFCFLNYKNLDNCYYPLINTWIEHLDGYVFVNWMKEFLTGNEYCEFCLSRNKYAYYADYVRAYAAYHYGGIYMDCDVVCWKSFDEFLDLPYLIDIEDLLYWNPHPNETQHISIFPAAFATTPKMPLFTTIMEQYSKFTFASLEELEAKSQWQLYNSVIIINAIWANAVADAKLEIVFNPNDSLEPNREMFKNEPYDPANMHKLMLNNGHFFCKGDSDWPNRLFYLVLIDEFQIHHMPCAFTSHQIISAHTAHCLKNDFLYVIIDDGSGKVRQRIMETAAAIDFENPILVVYTDGVKLDTDMPTCGRSNVRYMGYRKGFYNDVNQLVTSPQFYYNMLAYIYAIVLKPGQKLPNAWWPKRNIYMNTLDKSKYAWLGGFTNTSIPMRSTIELGNLCHDNPNKKGLPDCEYFKELLADTPEKIFIP